MMLYESEDFLVNECCQEYPNLSMEVIHDIVGDIINIYDRKDSMLEKMVEHMKNEVYLFSWKKLSNHINELVNKGVIIYNVEDEYYCPNKNIDVVCIVKCRLW